VPPAGRVRAARPGCWGAGPARKHAAGAVALEMRGPGGCLVCLVVCSIRIQSVIEAATAVAIILQLLIGAVEQELRCLPANL
jgi:hypothetical protein